MPGTVWTKVESVSYGSGWTRTDLENGGYRLTSTGGENADATITRDSPTNPTIEVKDRRSGERVDVSLDEAVPHLLDCAGHR